MKQIIQIFLLVLLTNFGLSAQVKGENELTGDTYFAVYNFDESIKFYLRAETLTVQGQRNLAESYSLSDQHLEAEPILEKIVVTQKSVVPTDYYMYAMTLKRNGKVDLSNQWMDKFVQETPNDLRAKSYQQHKKQLVDYEQAAIGTTIIPQDMNSSAQEFGPSFYGDRVVYASTNTTSKMFKKKYQWNNQPFLSLYVAPVSNDQLINSAFFDKGLNTKWHDGPASFTGNGKEMILTRNNAEALNKDRIAELGLMLFTYKDDQWSEPIPFVYNNPSYSVGQAAISEDGKLMFFVSDMPGGFGGTDIYKTTKTPYGEWSKPVNMGDQINTESDELFPFMNEATHELFFASNGHFGIGGFDLFKTSITAGEKMDVKNLGAPFNTREDDFSYVYNSALNKGFISSNRNGGKGGDDIYGFVVGSYQKKIVGRVIDQKARVVADTKVELFDNEQRYISSVFSDAAGKYSFVVFNDLNFELRGNKASYTEGRTFTNSFGDKLEIQTELLLKKVDTVVAVVKDDLSKKIKLKPIYFDFDKSDIREDAAKELEKVVKFMNDNPTTKVELTSHTDCRGTEVYNDSLSQRRADASVEYIAKRIIHAERITGKGAGEREPLTNCECEGVGAQVCTIWAHQQNRRTDFRIVK